MHTAVGRRGHDGHDVHRGHGSFGAHVMPGSGHDRFSSRVPVGGATSYGSYGSYNRYDDGGATAVAGVTAGLALGSLAATTSTSRGYVSLAKMPYSTKIALLVTGIIALVAGLALTILGCVVGNPALIVSGFLLLSGGVVMTALGGAGLNASSSSHGPGG